MPIPIRNTSCIHCTGKNGFHFSRCKTLKVDKKDEKKK